MHGDVMVALVVVARVIWFVLGIPLPYRVNGHTPSMASVTDYALPVCAFRFVAHNVGVGITLPVLCSSQS